MNVPAEYSDLDPVRAVALVEVVEEGSDGGRRDLAAEDHVVLAFRLLQTARELVPRAKNRRDLRQRAREQRLFDACAVQ